MFSKNVQHSYSSVSGPQVAVVRSGRWQECNPLLHPGLSTRQFSKQEINIFSQCTHHTTPHHITSRHITVWNIVVQCQPQPCPVTFIVSRNQLGRLNIPTITIRFLPLPELNSAMQTLHSQSDVYLFEHYICPLHCIVYLNQVQ